MDRSEVHNILHEALEKAADRLNGSQDSTNWSVSIGAPPDALTDDPNAGTHNFMVTFSKNIG